MTNSTTVVGNRKREYRNRLYVILFWIFIWFLVSHLIGNEILVAGPLQVIKTLSKNIAKFAFWRTIWNSLTKIGLGFLLAFSFGTIMGSIAFCQRWLQQLLAPMISLMKSIPVASFIVVALIWIQSKNLSIFISFFVVFPMVYITMNEGLQQVDASLLEMTTVFQVGKLKKIRYVYLSEVLPYIIANTKVTLGMCWKSGISAEIIGLPKHSIGEKLYLSKLYLDTSELFAWTIVIVLLSVGFEKTILYLLKKLEARLTT